MYLFLCLKVGSASMEKVTLILFIIDASPTGLSYLLFENLYPFAKGFF